MKSLIQRMTEDLQLRNRSPRTIQTYVSHVVRFAEFHECSPRLLGREEVRAYQVHLRNLGVSWSLFNQAVCALRFLYKVTLQVDWPVEQIPYGRKPKTLRVVLAQDEVVRLIEAVDNPMYRIALMTAYASGVRITELVALKAEHVDSARMLLHIELGKGQKSRLVPLSEVLLAHLRDYWRKDRPKVEGSSWLFPSEDPERPLHKTTIEKAWQRARAMAGLKKHATPHTLRHSYATGGRGGLAHRASAARSLATLDDGDLHARATQAGHGDEEPAWPRTFRGTHEPSPEAGSGSGRGPERSGVSAIVARRGNFNGAPPRCSRPNKAVQWTSAAVAARSASARLEGRATMKGVEAALATDRQSVERTHVSFAQLRSGQGAAALHALDQITNGQSVGDIAPKFSTVRRP